MKWYQKEIVLGEKKRGFHIITNEILKHIPEIAEIQTGLANIFIQHTSASLTINENADPDVREDFETHFNVMVPEDEEYYKHTDEGPDDMTSHIKASILGSQLTIPITKGKLNLGTWQGIYLCEHRDHGGRRKIIITILGS
ncbi:MAG: secondary thiamine-phosphate synthase enzyme YjbQ [Ignavibacteria bacterium]